MTNPLENKVVVITGAQDGLGSFMTEGFLAAGAVVFGVARSIQQSAHRNCETSVFRFMNSATQLAQLCPFEFFKNDFRRECVSQ